MTRHVQSLVTAHRQLEGGGFIVRRPFPTQGLDHVDPFLLVDELGPFSYGPGEFPGAPAHPHRGFETVSYILEGELEHEDSAGHKGTLGPGDVQWMTAGRGIVHDESPSARLRKEGGRVHGFQIWVNLPARDKMMAPRYQEVPKARIPEGVSADGKARVKVIAGEALGARAVIDTRTPITYQDWTLAPGALVEQPLPAGDDGQAPRASLSGREMGMDFAGKDGWRMYHGRVVPGFPQHPHRGFETVTIGRRGYIDHADSLGATARFGDGDVQWLTAGKGISHSEMFPLLKKDADNPLELFQIWLNLAPDDKLADPHFSMLWSDSIPVVVEGGTRVTVVAGALAGHWAPAPPPRSWAARPDSDVAIWTLRMEPGARFTLPAAGPTTNRALFFFAGDALALDGSRIAASSQVSLAPALPVTLENVGATTAELLLLQGRPIGAPVAQHGPFVMNTRAEIQQAFLDYERTRFGGWPWPSDGPVHPREAGRFARHADGKADAPPPKGR